MQRELGGVDAGLVFSAKLAGFTPRPAAAAAQAACSSPSACRRRSEGNLEINPFEFFLKDPTIIYSAVGTVQDMRELVDLAAAGKVKSHVVAHRPARPSSATIFDELEAGQYLGRAVITDFSQ